MLSSEHRRAGWKSRAMGALLATALLAGCQAQPLYGSFGGQAQSVSVSPATSRVEQIVREELILGFGGEQTNAAYRLDLTVSTSSAGILPGGVANEFSAGRTTVTANYVLRSVQTGETLANGSRYADAQLDLPSQQFAQQRAQLEAQNRAARTVATLVRADIAAALARQ